MSIRKANVVSAAVAALALGISAQPVQAKGLRIIPTIEGSTINPDKAAECVETLAILTDMAPSASSLDAQASDGTTCAIDDGLVSIQAANGQEEMTIRANNDGSIQFGFQINGRRPIDAVFVQDDTTGDVALVRGTYHAAYGSRAGSAFNTIATLWKSLVDVAMPLALERRPDPVAAIAASVARHGR